MYLYLFAFLFLSCFTPRSSLMLDSQLAMSSYFTPVFLLFWAPLISPNLPISLPANSGRCTTSIAIEPPPLAPFAPPLAAIRPKLPLPIATVAQLSLLAHEPKVCKQPEA